MNPGEKLLVQSHIIAIGGVGGQVACVNREHYAHSVGEYLSGQSVPQLGSLHLCGFLIVEIDRWTKKYVVRQFPQKLHCRGRLQQGVFALIGLVEAVVISYAPEFKREMAEIAVIDNPHSVGRENVVAPYSEIIESRDRAFGVYGNVAPGGQGVIPRLI